VEVLTRVEPDRIARLHKADEFFWLDLLNPTAEELHTLQELLDLHPAAIEDTLEWDQIPKLDDYGEHAMLVFFSARVIDGDIEPVEAHVYVAGGFMLTFRHCECPLDHLHERLEMPEGRSEDQSLYMVLNALADGWDPVIDQLDKLVDAVEVQVLERPRKEHLPTIYRLKQRTGQLTRVATPQRDLLPGAVDVIQELPGLERGSREWLRDVITHMDAIASDLSRLMDDLLALTSTFFNASAYRLNRLATFITVGSIFFLVWTLVTGFFGQNFKWLVDSVQTRGDFLLFGIGGLIVPTVALGAAFYARRRDWM
jgi:magnesium transporter